MLGRMLLRQPAVLHLPAGQAILLGRFLAHPLGFVHLKATGFIARELQEWRGIKNLEYAIQAEEGMQAVLSGKGSKRGGLSNTYCPPIHFYSNLCRSRDGVELLKVGAERGVFDTADVAQNSSVVDELLSSLRTAVKIKAEFTDALVRQVKAALWAVANIGSCAPGANFLRICGTYKLVTEIAESCTVLSIRGSAAIRAMICAAQLTKDGIFCAGAAGLAGPGQGGAAGAWLGGQDERGV